MIWFLDTFKQVTGQLTQHFFNLLISNKAGEKIGIQCEWYLINLLCDCSIGLIILYFVQIFLIFLFKGTSWEYKSGIYTKGEDETFEIEKHHIDFRLFYIQVICWIVIVLIVIEKLYY